MLCNTYYQEGKEPDFTKWFEKGWWTPYEALVAFLGHPPYEWNKSFSHLIATSDGIYVNQLIQAAITDGSIEGYKQISEKTGRASCADWIRWALKKESIKKLLKPHLLEFIDIDENFLRHDESYRPEIEKENKIKFIITARICLHLCDKARLEDIKNLSSIDPSIILPTDKTLRKWLKEENINLFKGNQKNHYKKEIEKKLSPLNL